MLGALLQQAKTDAAFFASAGGFQVNAILTTPDGSTSLPVTGLATGTWMRFDDDSRGRNTNSTSDSLDIPEVQLIAANYPYKNIKGRIDLRNHTVIVDDGGNSMSDTYTITEEHPNATFGMIICILGKATVKTV